jgi:hypothetical protein
LKTGCRPADFLRNFTQKLFFNLFGPVLFASLSRRFFTASTDELFAELAPLVESGNEMPRPAQMPPLQAVVPTRLPQSLPPALLLQAGLPPAEQSRRESAAGCRGRRIEATSAGRKTANASKRGAKPIPAVGARASRKPKDRYKISAEANRLKLSRLRRKSCPLRYKISA